MDCSCRGIVAVDGLSVDGLSVDGLSVDLVPSRKDNLLYYKNIQWHVWCMWHCVESAVFNVRLGFCFCPLPMFRSLCSGPHEDVSWQLGTFRSWISQPRALSWHFLPFPSSPVMHLSPFSPVESDQKCSRHQAINLPKVIVIKMDQNLLGPTF
jgi:hypothetical protein